VGKFASWADALVIEDPEQRREALEFVVEIFSTHGLRLQEGRALTDLGDAYDESGRDAREVYERALEVLEECGARLYVRELDSKVRQARVLED
jgi:hypothetical protein